MTLIRIHLGHYAPRAHRTGAPQPLWLVWHGQAVPADLAAFWRRYGRRFAIEHAFRFLKQDLGWTTPRVRAPQTAERWSWLLAMGLWQLWVARDVVTQSRLPWNGHPGLIGHAVPVRCAGPWPRSCWVWVPQPGHPDPAECRQDDNSASVPAGPRATQRNNAVHPPARNTTTPVANGPDRRSRAPAAPRLGSGSWLFVQTPVRMTRESGGHIGTGFGGSKGRSSSPSGSW